MTCCTLHTLLLTFCLHMITLLPGAMPLKAGAGKLFCCTLCCRSVFLCGCFQWNLMAAPECSPAGAMPPKAGAGEMV